MGYDTFSCRSLIFKKLLYLSEYFLLILWDCKSMQISLGNWSVSAVIYDAREKGRCCNHPKQEIQVWGTLGLRQKVQRFLLAYPNSNYPTSYRFWFYCVYVTKMQFGLHIRIRDHPGNCKKNIFSANNPQTCCSSLLVYNAADLITTNHLNYDSHLFTCQNNLIIMKWLSTILNSQVTFKPVLLHSLISRKMLT